MTSIEWFATQLYEKIEMKGNGNVIDDLLQQAKEMHKQEMKQLSQQEISDEEIEKEARQYTYDEYQKVVDYEKYDTYSDFINGVKWAINKLKNK